MTSVPVPPASGPAPSAGPAQAWLPRPYPQLLRGPRHRWWRPLLGTAVLLGLVVVLILAGALVALVVALASPESSEAGATGTDSQEAFDEWSISPAGLLVTNLVLAAGIPAALLAVFVGHGWRPGWVASVVGRLRWSWLLVAAAVTAAVYVPIILVLGAFGQLGEGSPEPQAAWLLLVVLLTTPLQAAGEEYVFRGWLTQALGSLFARAVPGALVAGAVSATLFALAHGQQDPWLFLDRFAFGVVASWLVWRTGGLEAGIAVHAVNNLVAFVPTILLGQLSEALVVTESTPVSLVLNVGQLLLVAFLLDRLARRRQLGRLHVPPAQPDPVAWSWAGPGGPGGWAPPPAPQQGWAPPPAPQQGWAPPPPSAASAVGPAGGTSRAAPAAEPTPSPWAPPGGPGSPEERI